MDKILASRNRTARWLHAGAASVVLLACVYEAFTKGWLSFFFVPALVVVVALVLIGQFGFRAELYGFSRRVYRAVGSLRVIQLVASLALYVCGVGFGDTEAVWLFGAVPSTVDAPLTVLSGLLSIVGGAVFVASSIALLAFFFVSLLQKRIRRRFTRIVD